MELDGMKEASKLVKAPQWIGSNSALMGPGPLLQQIRDNDERESKQARRALPFYFAAMAIFALVCFAGISSTSAPRAAHNGALALVFMVIGVALLKKLRDVRNLDYSSPVRTFLKETEARYRFFGPLAVCYSIPLLALLAVTGGFFVVNAFIPRIIHEAHLVPLVVAYGIFFISLCAAGFFFSYKNWKRDRGIILDEIRRMLRELESQSD